MGIFSLPSNYPVGIDISDLSLKLIQLQKTRNGIAVQTLSKKTVPDGYLKEGIIKNKPGLTELLKELVSETIFGKVTSREVVAVLPESKTFIKLINSSRSSDNTEEIIKSEIEKNIPYELSEVNYDWQLISKKSASQQILVGVVPKNIADEYAAVLAEAGLMPVALEIEAVAIARSVLPIRYRSAKTVLIIDIGATRSGLIAYAQDTILFTISLPVSGTKYTKIIAQKLKLALNKAEEAKIICGLDPAAAHGIVASILDEMTADLINKIKAALLYLSEHYPDAATVEKIYLCGGGANLKDLDKTLTAKLKIETKISDIFADINITQRQKNRYFEEESKNFQKMTPNYQQKQNFSLNFATATGLALRNIYT